MRSSGDIRADLAIWYPARNALAKGQSYTMGGISVTRADLATVNATIKDLEQQLSLAQAAERGDTTAANGFGCVQLLRGP